MLLVDDLAAGGTKNLRHTPRGLVTLISLPVNYLHFNFKVMGLIQLFYPPTKSEGYSFGVVRPSVRPFRPSVRPHVLSVRNHISVPIGQI